ncbi:flagellar basal body protein [Sandarakinorhabdus sp. AAP62]|uniref:FlgK family flagellar hook-associated protein n=1 Tax=Sandarakinorhabdus sp. AAP62 TaxID=1248916 RepID=UPI0003121D40|nr:flagellar basal body protein [Sandarakinorhabdus sp. AAP62]
MMDLLSLGRSGVLAFQNALNATGDNVANADTPGFVRRRIVLATQPAGSGGPFQRATLSGAGVRTAALVRDVDPLKANAARIASGDQARFGARLDWLQRLESLAATADVVGRVGGFFDAATRLAAAPTQPAARTVFLDAAEDAAAAFAGHGRDLEQLEADVRAEAGLSARRVNDLAAALVRVNDQLRRGDRGDIAAAGLLDNRDRLLADLADEVRISVSEGERGVVEVKLGFGPSAVLLVPRAGNSSRIGIAPDGQSVLLDPDHAPVPLRLPASGRLAGLLEASGQIIRARAALDGSAGSFATMVNNWHQQGIDALGQPGQAIFATTATRTSVGKANAGQAPLDVVLADGATPFAGGYRLIAEAGGFTLARTDNSASITGPSPLLLDGLTVTIGNGWVSGDQWTVAPLTGAQGLSLRPLQPAEVAAAARWQIDGLPSNGARSLPEIFDDATALALPGGDTTPPPWRITVIAGGLAEIRDPTGVNLLATVPADGSLIEGPGVRFRIPADAAEGDLFRIAPTPAGAQDNRNLLELGRLRAQPGPNGTIEAVLDADLAGIGAGVSDTRRLETAAASLKEDAARANDAVSAVDLEKEAAELTRLQAAYRANAQVIGVARDLFDQILGLAR